MNQAEYIARVANAVQDSLRKAQTKKVADHTKTDEISFNNWFFDNDAIKGLEGSGRAGLLQVWLAAREALRAEQLGLEGPSLAGLLRVWITARETLRTEQIAAGANDPADEVKR